MKYFSINWFSKSKYPMICETIPSNSEEIICFIMMKFREWRTFIISCIEGVNMYIDTICIYGQLQFTRTISAVFVNLLSLVSASDL